MKLNATLKLFLYLFYQFAKLVVKISLRIFYPDTSISNRKYLREDNPSIVVSNHPNALIDPLHTAGRVKKMVHFLVNASLYKTTIGNWFFSTFYCIPIERPKDVGSGAIQNDDSFAKCDEFLSGGGTLFIAPQGASEWKRRLGELKTGTARIALSAENKNNFKLGLTIIPIGLNYSAPYAYRSKIFINVGVPIVVSKYEEAYREDNFNAAKKLTADLENQMKDLLIETVDEDEDLLVKKLESVQQNEKPLPFNMVFHRTKKLITNLRNYKATQNDDYFQFKETVDDYFSTLKEYKLNDRAVKKNITSIWKNLDGLGLILGLPFFLYGWLNNLIAHVIPSFLVRLIKTYPVYDATIKYMGGLLIFPIIYGLQIWGVYFLTNDIWTTLIYLLSLYPLGAFARWYRKYVGQFFKNKRFVESISAQQKEKLLTSRRAILDHLSAWK